MKKNILILILIVMTSCSKEEDKNNYEFRNSTSFGVVVSPYENLLDGAPNFAFNVNANETKTYSSEYMYSIFKITSNATNKNFSYKFSGNTRVIYSFEKMVLYKITGTASSADITYRSSSGNTIQSTVTLPYSIGYDYFASDFKYISAQNNTNTGSVKVELYYEDNLLSSDICSGNYCIATASN